MPIDTVKRSPKLCFQHKDKEPGTIHLKKTIKISWIQRSFFRDVELDFMNNGNVLCWCCADDGKTRELTQLVSPVQRAQSY